MPFYVTVPEGRSAAPGDPVVSQKQDDGSFKHWAEGETVKKSDFPEDGWAWLLETGLVVERSRRG